MIPDKLTIKKQEVAPWTSDNLLALQKRNSVEAQKLIRLSNEQCKFE